MHLSLILSLIAKGLNNYVNKVLEGGSVFLFEKKNCFSLFLFLSLSLSLFLSLSLSLTLFLSIFLSVFRSLSVALCE